MPENTETEARSLLSLIPGSVRLGVDAQYAPDVAITAVTAGEVPAGIARMPSGRTDQVNALIESKLTGAFAGRLFPLDAECAFAYTEIVNLRAPRQSTST